MALATAQDVQDRLLGQTLTTEEKQVVEVRLGDAERLLKARIADLLAKAESDVDYFENVVMVEAEMVLRLIKNPEGYIQETDGNYSYMISQQVASGRLTVMDDEWSLLGIRQSFHVLQPFVKLPWEV